MLYIYFLLRIIYSDKTLLHSILFSVFRKTFYSILCVQKIFLHVWLCKWSCRSQWICKLAHDVIGRPIITLYVVHVAFNSDELKGLFFTWITWHRAVSTVLKINISGCRNTFKKQGARARAGKSFAVVYVRSSSWFCVRARVLVFLCVNACTLHDHATLARVDVRVNGASMDYILTWTGSGARAVRDVISNRIWPSTMREVHFTDYSELSHGSTSAQPHSTGLTTLTKLTPFIQFKHFFLFI